MKLKDKLIGNYWRPIRTIWPYPIGWGTYNKYKNTLLDSGLPSKEYAQHVCDELNRGKQ